VINIISEVISTVKEFTSRGNTIQVQKSKLLSASSEIDVLRNNLMTARNTERVLTQQLDKSTNQISGGRVVLFSVCSILALSLTLNGYLGFKYSTVKGIILSESMQQISTPVLEFINLGE
jgi:hypothetical protein